MPASAYPDHRTAREREQDRRRVVAESRRLAAQEAASRKVELERLEQLRAAGAQTPETHPDRFRRIVLDVHVDFLVTDLTIMSRILSRIVEGRRDAYASGDTAAYREANEEGEYMTEILRQYLMHQMREEEERGGSGEYEKTRALVGKAARSSALRKLRQKS